ncbi:hypothetical protein IHQ68_08020 [Chelatococcus sambhunathii]|uniref:Uncharacterized protein n=1 Tax=Chelatococcus sambhunathii TaxID=363953 RepID=A0ABU1DES2_9HYPH|nr:hypothetical protein [Chelatococcus sambhunathii]MDR4306561.1 hypothetical protein [Chelatococcus sambhunathii]
MRQFVISGFLACQIASTPLVIEALSFPPDVLRRRERLAVEAPPGPISPKVALRDRPEDAEPLGAVASPSVIAERLQPELKVRSVSAIAACPLQRLAHGLEVARFEGNDAMKVKAAVAVALKRERKRKRLPDYVLQSPPDTVMQKGGLGRMLKGFGLDLPREVEVDGSGRAESACAPDKPYEALFVREVAPFGRRAVPAC